MNGSCFEKLTDMLSGSGWRVLYTDVTGSTNGDLMALARKGVREKILLAAGAQTSGRGRRGREFFSPSDTGVYFSMLTGCGYGLVTPRAAVAAAHAITAAAGRVCEIKWVNDIFMDGLKVCGILAESCLPDYIVTGIGINLTTADYPDYLKGIAGSIGAADRDRLIYDIVTEFEGLSDSEVIAEYRRLSMTVGRRVTVSETGMCGIAEDINDEGNLIVRFDNGHTEVIRSGEVSVKPAGMPFSGNGSGQ